MGVSLVSHIEGGTWLRISKNRVLRKIFGPQRDEVTGKCRRLCNEELYDLYASPNIFVVKSRRILWVVHMAHGGQERCLQALEGRPDG